MPTSDQTLQPDGLPQGTPERLRKEFGFYNSGSIRHLTKFQRWKTLQIIAGASIPLAAVLIPPTSASPAREYALRATTATLGAFVAVVESYLQFRQFHQNWVRWRTAAEGLRREAFLFAQKAGQYRTAEDPEVLLAENVEEIVAIEQRSWRSLQENPHPVKHAGRAD